MIQVLICDDQAVVREGLAAILNTVSQIEITGLAADGQEALQLIAQRPPHVVLMDLNMPRMNGVQATRRIRDQFKKTYVLVLTTYADDDWVFDAIRAGASGYLLKDTRREQLVQAIEGTAQGKSYLDPSIAGKIMTLAVEHKEPLMFPIDQPIPDLTLREKEIIQLIAEGYSNPEVAKQLHLAPGTVRNYISEIFAKLEVSDRVQVAVKAIKLGIL